MRLKTKTKTKKRRDECRARPCHFACSFADDPIKVNPVNLDRILRQLETIEFRPRSYWANFFFSRRHSNNKIKVALSNKQTKKR